MLITNRSFTVLILAAACLRVLVMAGYRPARIYWYDSYTYLKLALDIVPRQELNPSGYPFFLRLLAPFDSVAAVVAVQHLMGLGAGALVYALLRRKKAPVWVAVPAAAPVLLDASFLRLEHAVLSDVLFLFLVLAAVVLVMWSPLPSVRTLIVAGLLLAWATLTRTIGLPVLLLTLAHLLVRRAGPRRLLATAAAGILPLLLYAGWYHSEYGSFKLVTGEGAALWARTMTFADCAVIRPPANERPLCPNGVRHEAAEGYFWDADAPLGRLPGGLARNNDLAYSFAVHAILAQPWDYLGKVAENVSFAFHWTPVDHPRRTTGAFGFGGDVAAHPAPEWARKALEDYSPGTSGGMDAVAPYSSLIQAYQYPAYLRGPFLAALLLLGALGLWRGRTFLPWGVAAGLLVLPVALLDFDHRYVLPTVPFACLAAALALTAPLDRRGAGAGGRDRPQT